MVELLTGCAEELDEKYLMLLALTISSLTVYSHDLTSPFPMLDRWNDV